MSKKTEFEIDGVITTPEGLTDEHVSDAIIEFIESKGWSFGGKVSNKISKIKLINTPNKFLRSVWFLLKWKCTFTKSQENIKTATLVKE